MLKKKGKGSKTGEETGVSARQTGLLDAYTETQTAASASDSDKFKEGYKKKGKKNEKSRKSESEDVVKEEPKEINDSWDAEEEIVESWEDIEAPEMPVPAKVKQEMRKQEKQRKKEEEKKTKTEKEETPAKNSDVEKISDMVENVKLDESNAKVEDPVAVKSERDAKKAAKAAAKNAAKQKKSVPAAEIPEATSKENAQTEDVKLCKEKTEEQKQKEAEKAKRKAEFEAKMAADKVESKGEGGKSKAELKAERRAKQEAQRAAKTQEQKQKPGVTKVRIPDEIQADQKKAQDKLAKVLATHNVPPRTKAQRLVPLFSHLHQYEKDSSVTKDLPAVGGSIHPRVVEVGLQLTEGEVAGSEERCKALLSVLEDVVLDCVSQIKDMSQVDLFKEIDNALKPNLTFLKQCRPLSVAMSNALRVIKSKLKAIDRSSPMEELCTEIKTIFADFIQENLHLAAQQISETGRLKIKNGDVLLTYSHSNLVERLLIEASREKNFRVIVADSRVPSRGRVLADKLVKEGIETTYILLTALTQVLAGVTKVFLGCDGVLANGCVLAQVGTSQVALIAESAGIPVLVCCQTFKFTERVQTDSFVNNELLDPSELVPTTSTNKYLENWRDYPSLHLLNLVYDITPASLITAVITELSVIPTTSVPVILRLKNTEAHLMT